MVMEFINVGHGSIAIPGMLKSLELAWKRHGSLPERNCFSSYGDS